jgi:hypothetical protein
MKRRLIWLLLVSSAFGQMYPYAPPAPTSGGGATLTYVGSNTKWCAGGSFPSEVCALSYSATNANLLIADLECNDPTTSQNPTLTTDNGSSTWANGFVDGTNVFGYYFREDYTLAAAGSLTTVSGHCGASSASATLTIREYHRTSGSWTFGGAPSGVTTGLSNTVATGNSVTPTASVPALISGGFFNRSSSSNWGNSGSFTNRTNIQDSTTGETVGTSDEIITSASGSYAAVASQGSNVNWAAWTTWFK